MENPDNRTRLLECANGLFYAKGYDAVGVQEVVDQAGLTKPTLYYYFGSKKGLLEQLLETKFRRMRELKETFLMDGNPGIQESLYRLADIFCDFFEQDRKFYMLLMALLYSARENEAYQAVKPYMKELYETVVQVFERSAAQLGNMNGRQKQFAIGFIGSINHYFLLHCEADPDDLEKIEKRKLRALVDQFMYGIFS